MELLNKEMFIFCYTKWERKLENKKTFRHWLIFFFCTCKYDIQNSKIHSLLQQKCKKDELQLYNIVSDPEEKTNLVRALLL
jgi:hypothetical protein